MGLDLVRAIKAPFSAKGWFLKSLLAGIAIMIPIVNFIVFGYFIVYLKNVMKEKDELPDFSNAGTLFGIGCKWFLGCILLTIPVLLILFVIISFFGNPSEVIIKLAAPENQLPVQAASMMICFFYYLFELSFAMDYKVTSMVNVSRAFKFIQGNVVNFIILILYMFVVTILIMLVNFVLAITIVGIILLPMTIFLSYIMLNNLVGQFGKSAPLYNEIIIEASTKH